MNKKIFALKKEEMGVVKGGNFIEAGGVFLDTFLNTGTALTCIGIMQEVQAKLCTNNTTWVKTCVVSKELSSIIGFTLHSFMPTVYKGLADPILPTREHPD